MTKVGAQGKQESQGSMAPSRSIRELDLDVGNWSFQQGRQRLDLVHLGIEFCPDPICGIASPWTLFCR